MITHKLNTNQKIRNEMDKMETDEQEKLFNLIKQSLWNTKMAKTVEWSLYEEMKKQAIAILTAGILSQLEMPDELRRDWEQTVYQQIAYNVNYRRFQAGIPLSVPYVILKGSSAAKNYPHPEFRTMGDIDIMTRRDDYSFACEELIQNGYLETTNALETARGRHRQFVRNGFEIEVHAHYAHQNDVEKAKRLDDLIIDHIHPSHELPDDINGLVLIDHVNHHMESGIGLRQIIDWMMYVHRCLPDEKWPEFQALARQTGHETLALITTRMCELYLGLPEHRFCAQADPALCGQLMDYILSNGNFGRKQDEDSKASKGFLGSVHSLKGAYQYLQGRGLLNWPAAQKYRFLRPFAWIHQGFRYVKKGFHRKDTLAKLKDEREAGKKRSELFNALGISREEKGIVRFKNGRYLKE